MARLATRRFNHSLRIGWRGPAAFANDRGSNAFEADMPPESLQMLLALALGFAVAGLCSSAYQLATSRLPSFSLLNSGPSPAAFAAVPLLMVAAPFLIMRNTLRGRQQEGRRFEFVFLATLIAGFWSLMSGMVLVMTLQACALLLA
jgi:O-antigen/teichoic acid export membrane protein